MDADPRNETARMATKDYHLGRITTSVEEATRAIELLRQDQVKHVGQLATIAQQLLNIKELVDRLSETAASYDKAITSSRESVRIGIEAKVDEKLKEFEQKMAAKNETSLSRRDKMYVIGSIIVGIFSVIATIISNIDKIFK